MNTERTWSPEQNAIFRWFAKGAGNLVVTARAGTGKTTTIIEAIEHAPETDIVLCAFNKRIAEELKSKLRNPAASARTLHSIGNGLVMRYWGRVKIDADRGFDIAASVCGPSAPDPIIKLTAKLAAAGKNMAPLATGEAGIGELVDIAWEQNLVPDAEWEEEGFTVEVVAGYALQAMERAAVKDGNIDFDDMVYLPVRNKWVRGKHDLVIVDECQDMNATQLLLARGICKGRMVVVGDDRQAIYGFRGADSESLTRMSKELKATTLPLCTTYRCGKAIVAEAQRLVPDYRAAEGNPKGEIVRGVSTDKLPEMADLGDFVLSRTNAPLVRTCLALLRRGKRARIEGRDMAKGLVTLVRGFRARSIPELMTKLTAWESKQVARLKAQGRKSAESQIEAINDKADTLRELAAGLSGPAELETRLETLFSDGASGSVIVCSSVHRAKGLEAERVFILADTLYCNGKRRDQEEANIEYVAITRAKKTLVLVSDK
jgi:superfamily I DNA/RNA helicase